MALGHIISTIGVKGGVGKTTTCYLLGQELLKRGHSVAIIDFDPNGPFINLRNFRKLAGREPLCPIYSTADLTEAGFFDAIDKLASEHDFTLLDCEGSQNFMLTKATSVSTLTLIPLKHSPLDAWSLPTITRLVKEQSRIMRRPLPYRVLLNFTASGAVVTTWERETINELDQSRIPRLETLLYDGNIFKDMFGEASTLYEMQAEAENALAAPEYSMVPAHARKTDEAKKRVDKAILRMKALCDEIFTVMTDTNAQSAAIAE